MKNTTAAPTNTLPVGTKVVDPRTGTEGTIVWTNGEEILLALTATGTRVRYDAGWVRRVR